MSDIYEMTRNPNADLALTGWTYGDRMKPGFVDNMDESDHRGHSLNATDRIPSGGMKAFGYRGTPCPLLVTLHRDLMP